MLDTTTDIEPVTTPVGTGRDRGRTVLAGIAEFLAPVPVVCFSGTLLTDFVYSRSTDMQWANFSAWLLLFGIVLGSVAAFAGAIDVIHRRIVRRHDVLVRIAGSAVVWILSLFNNLVHSRDAWTSVVPTGLLLSLLTVLAMIATAVLTAVVARKQSTGV